MVNRDTCCHHSVHSESYYLPVWWRPIKNKIKKVKKVVDKTWSLEYTNKGVSDDTK